MCFVSKRCQCSLCNIADVKSWMMTRWRSGGLALSCGTAVLAAWAVAGFPPLDSPRIKTSNVAPTQDHSTIPVRANTDSVGALRASAMEKADASETDLATSDECFVPVICIDRYLWMLYQRTPKLDTIKVVNEHKVTKKKNGKKRIIIKKFTKLVNENFAWKDPQAAEKAGLAVMDYVIGGMDPSFKLKLYHALRASEEAGFSPGITSAFRDDYRQSITSGLKAATDRSFHGGSLRGGYGHGLAADIVSVNGEARESSKRLWEWIDAHGKEFGIGRPYLDKDPPHVAPIDGEEYAAHHSDAEAQHAEAKKKKNKGPVARDDGSTGKRLKTAKPAKARTV